MVNALKFTDKGGVEIRASSENGKFHLAVIDSGPAIAPADQARIFEEFQQIDTSSTRKKGGTGLGLSISRSLSRCMVVPSPSNPNLARARRSTSCGPSRRNLRGIEHVAFPPREFELLESLLRRKGRLLTREFLIEEIWGADYVGDTKTLDVHVKRIRGKIESDPHEPRHLTTIRGLGYKFVG